MNNSGHVYVLINPSLDGLLKIGKTTRAPIDRAKELSSSTGVPTPFVVAYDAYFPDCSKAEQYVHVKLESKGYRLSPNKEFFDAPLKDVIDAIIEAKHHLNHSADDNAHEISNPVITESQGLSIDPQNEDELPVNNPGAIEADEIEDEIEDDNYPTVAYNNSQYILSLKEINDDIGIQLGKFTYENTEDATKNLSMKGRLTDSMIGIVESIFDRPYATRDTMEMVTGFTMCVDMFDSDDEKYRDLLEDKDNIFYCLTYLKDDPDSIFGPGWVYFWFVTIALIKFYEKLSSIRSGLTTEQQSLLNDVIESASEMATEFDTYVKDVNTKIEAAIPAYERYLSQIRRIVKYEHFTNHSIDETVFQELRKAFKSYLHLRRSSIMKPEIIVNWLANNLTDDNLILNQSPWDDLIVNAINSRYGDKDEGIIKDQNEAKRFYIAASKLGNTAALVELGDMYLEGEFGEPSKDIALEYYKEAAKDGCAIAYLRMATLFAGEDEDNTEICINAYIKRRGNLQPPVTVDTINEIYNILYSLPDHQTFLPYLKYFSPIRDELLSRFEQGDPISNMVLDVIGNRLTDIEDMLDLIP